MQWVPIQGWPRYEISETGEIRTRWSRTCSPAGKIIKQRPNKYGRMQVTLQHDGRIYHTHVAPLVARAFIGPKPRGKEVKHKDGNKQNNSASNLEYLTRKQNFAHAVRMGLMPSGSRHPQAKLNETQVSSILSVRGISEGKLAKMYGVSRATISHIRHRKSWRHVMEPDDANDLIYSRNIPPDEAPDPLEELLKALHDRQVAEDERSGQ